jgi:hypothetical protein
MANSKQWMERMINQIEKWVDRGQMKIVCKDVFPVIDSKCAKSLRTMFGDTFPEDLMEFYSKATSGCKIWAVNKRGFPMGSILYSHYSGPMVCGFELLSATEMAHHKSEMEDFLDAIQDGDATLQAGLRPFMDYGIPVMEGSSPMSVIYLPENRLCAKGIYIVSRDIAELGVPALKLATDFNGFLSTLEETCYIWPETNLYAHWPDPPPLPSRTAIKKAILDAIEK